jgi:hypothetical protein
MDAVNQKNNNNKKLSKVLSTKLSIEDYNSFLILTKLEYESGLSPEEDKLLVDVLLLSTTKLSFCNISLTAADYQRLAVQSLASTKVKIMM